MIKRIFVIFSITLSSLAHAGWTCPSNGKTNFIDGVSYHGASGGDYYSPRIHFKDQGPYDWSYLMYHNGLDTPYGKAGLALALLAYSFKSQVRVVCSDNIVTQITITDTGGVSDN